MALEDMTTCVQATVKSINHKIMILADGIQSKDLSTLNEVQNFLTPPLIVVDGEFGAIMRWLSPVDPYENREAARSAHHQGTGLWFIESKEFEGWSQTEGSLLWLGGFRKSMRLKNP